jgi:hypothetical protein
MATYREVHCGVGAGAHNLTSDNNDTPHPACCRVPQAHIPSYEEVIREEEADKEMLRRQRLYNQVAETFKPWVEGNGIMGMFLDAYLRVGMVWLLLDQSNVDRENMGRMRHVHAARRSARYVLAPCHHLRELSSG